MENRSITKEVEVKEGSGGLIPSQRKTDFNRGCQLKAYLLVGIESELTKKTSVRRARGRESGSWPAIVQLRKRVGSEVTQRGFSGTVHRGRETEENDQGRRGSCFVRWWRIV